MVFRLVILFVVSVVDGGVFLICDHVRRPPLGGSASSKMMSGVVSLSSAVLVGVSDVSL